MNEDDPTPSARPRRARKQHQCIWCGEPIEPGEDYMLEETLQYASIQARKWHPECLKAWHEEADGCELAKFYPGQMRRP